MSVHLIFGLEFADQSDADRKLREQQLQLGDELSKSRQTLREPERRIAEREEVSKKERERVAAEESRRAERLQSLIAGLQEAVNRSRTKEGGENRGDCL